MNSQKIYKTNNLRERRIIKMKNHQKQDLRIIRTKKSIRDTFCSMIMEMEYQDITIKELTQRAMINRNTFYLHYSSIDALLEELQNEIVEDFISWKPSYQKLDDIKQMIRNFFEYVSVQSPLRERILTTGSYLFVYEQINQQIMEHERQRGRGSFGLDEASENIVFAYYGSITSIIYRQWIMDGKQLPLDNVIDLATKLICNGMKSVIN